MVNAESFFSAKVRRQSDFRKTIQSSSKTAVLVPHPVVHKEGTMAPESTSSGQGEGPSAKPLNTDSIAPAPTLDSDIKFDVTVTKENITLKKRQSPNTELAVVPLGTASKRPDTALHGLAILAICAQEKQRATKTEIQKWIVQNIPYYREQVGETGELPKAMEKSIRNLLSRSDCFQNRRDGDKSGSYWILDTQVFTDLLEQNPKFFRGVQGIKRPPSSTVARPAKKHCPDNSAQATMPGPSACRANDQTEEPSMTSQQQPQPLSESDIGLPGDEIPGAASTTGSAQLAEWPGDWSEIYSEDLAANLTEGVTENLATYIIEDVAALQPMPAPSTCTANDQTEDPSMTSQHQGT